MPKVNTDNILGKPPGHRTVDQDYELGKVLGKGAFGTVRLATHRLTGEKLACKSIAKAKLVCREDVQDVQREVAIMNHVAGHANVVNSKVSGARVDLTYTGILRGLRYVHTYRRNVRCMLLWH
jgi:serine/threonine protein kinase